MREAEQALVKSALDALNRITKESQLGGEHAALLFSEVIDPLVGFYDYKFKRPYTDDAFSGLETEEIDRHMKVTWEGARACLLAAIAGKETLDRELMEAILMQGEVFCQLNIRLIKQRHGETPGEAIPAMLALTKIRAPLAYVAGEFLQNRRAAMSAREFYTVLGDDEHVGHCDQLLRRLSLQPGPDKRPPSSSVASVEGGAQGASTNGLDSENTKRVTEAFSRWQDRLDRAREIVRNDVIQAEQAAHNAIDESLTALDTAAESVGPLSVAPFTDPRWRDFIPDSAAVTGPRLTRLGTLPLSLPMPGNTRRSETVPAMAPLIGRGNLFLCAKGVELSPLRDLLQAVALRLLATIPPGRLRLLLIDPVGLGQSFEHLLQLGEFVRGRAAWHEPGQIEEALVEVTVHMSNVIQRYLTNQYHDIEDYNQAAQEVAEPYRLVLVSDFPAGFEQRSAQRLLSIAQNGARVGVYVLLTMDTTREQPHKFPLDALLASGLVVRQQRDLRIETPPLDSAPLHLEALPDPQVITRIIESVNQGATRAQHVEVPFERILSPRLWEDSTRDALRTAIGRQGSRDLELVLGQGTAHHVLVGGTTGSGKSVLLHVLITSLCLRYSPKELQLYLVDFKEGVEMSVYRTLPHARVVAIESEREFGLSVLRGLRRELEVRGDRFRDKGAPNLNEYRQRSSESCPRVLLIIDEFQVFFTRNDRISGEARSLLDILVREGRSFGVHVLLASQALPGGEIATGTLSQLGVRIALRMSEADSYQILSKDNDEARYLERPGQAIYNDHAGQVGSNTRFQVANLSQAAREEYVGRIGRLAAEHGVTARPLLFEGNKPASVRRNEALLRVAMAGPPPGLRAVPLFLGEPAQVQDGHCQFRLRRQGRANLLLCGQDEDTAFQIFLATCASFLLYHRPEQRRLLVLDLSNVDGEIHGKLEALRRLRPDVRLGARRQVTPFLQEVQQEIAARAAAADSGAPAGPTLLLGIFGLHGAPRELQRQGIKATPELEALQRLLIDGPDLGAHALVWVNTYGRLVSAFDPPSRYLQEFGGTVAIRGGDSDKVLGPGGAGLAIKRHYGLLHLQGESDEVEKFRCYGDVLAWIEEQAAQPARR